MTRTYYYVLSAGTLWEVRRERAHVSFHSTKDVAMEVGRTAAKSEYDRTGNPTGLRVQKADGTWQEERSYGSDPYPPRG